MNTIKSTAVVYREDLYPRFKPNPVLIQEYSTNLESLPPIEVSQNNILIDGYHRWKAYQTAGVDDEWIYPRYKSSYSANEYFSGTPYREIDLSSMVEYEPEK